MGKRQVAEVIGVPIDVLTWSEAVARIRSWASQNDSRVVCICNSHSLVTAKKDVAFASILSNADMATADGGPVAYMVRRLGHASQIRINGPDLMMHCCADAAATGISIFLYGGNEQALDLLTQNLVDKFPGLKIAGAFSPPFRPLTKKEDERVVDLINSSGAGVVWVGLGCPKQEKWMSDHRGQIFAVMIGVGAAFDYHAGTIQRAPLWLQRNNFEWLYRLRQEPKRLWKRYLITNSLFVWHAGVQLLGLRKKRSSAVG